MQKRRNRWALAVTASAALFVAGTPAQALVINLTSTGNANADAGFAAAAAFWQNTFVDPVTVNITAAFAALGAGILGSASSVSATYSFSSVKTALTGDATSTDDTTMVNGLPGGTSFSRYINRTSDNPNGSGSATPYVDTGLTNLRLTNANAKAIGLLGANNAASDASITFSSNFAFDFDPTNGIGAGLIDFVGVAIHELGHAMGFVSGVDILDVNSPPVGGPFPAQGNPTGSFQNFVRPLDLTRVSAASLAAGADIHWTADTRAKDYSIDGGTTTLISNAWSTGVNFGDGRQASHWKDGLGIGIMDPTSAPAGQANVVTSNDIQALDVIGWTLQTVPPVPEPATLLLLGTGLLGALRLNRRRHASA